MGRRGGQAPVPRHRGPQGFKIHVKWDPATPNDKKAGRTIELWRDRNGREMVPMQLCFSDTEHLTGTEYTGEVHNACPLPQPQKPNRKAPADQASSASSTPDGAQAGHGPPLTTTGPQKEAPAEAHAGINILNEPAVTNNPTKAATLQAMPGPNPQGADLLGFLEQALRRADQPEPAPILDPEGNKYHAHWQRGVPLYHKTSVMVHAHPGLGVDGRLGA